MREPLKESDVKEGDVFITPRKDIVVVHNIRKTSSGPKCAIQFLRKESGSYAFNAPIGDRSYMNGETWPRDVWQYLGNMCEALDKLREMC